MPFVLISPKEALRRAASKQGSFEESFSADADTALIGAVPFGLEHVD